LEIIQVGMEKSPFPSLAPSRWGRRTERLVLAAVCLLAAGFRLYILRYHTFINWDGAYYVNYFRDSTWQSVFHPGYPLFIELFRLLIGDGVRAAQIVSVVFGALLPLPLFYLARHFTGSLNSFLITLLVALNPLMVRFGAMTMTEPLYIFLELSAFLFFFMGRPVLFGLTAGLAYLTRPEALLFFCLLIAYSAFKRKRQFVVYSLAGLLMAALPYVVYLRAETGQWTLSSKTMNLRVWEKDWHINVEREATNSPSFTLPERLQSGIKLYPDRLSAYSQLFLVFCGIPLVFLGLAGMFRAPNLLLAGTAMFFVLPLFGLNPGERFLIPYVPFLVIFAVLFVASWKRVSVTLLAEAVMLLGYYPTVSYPAMSEEGIEEFCTAGIAMRPQTRRGDIFVDRKPYTAFYAGGRYVPMPNDPVDSILAFSRRINAKYLVVSARVVRVFRPQLNFLLYSDTTIKHLNLKTAYVAGLDSGYGIRVIQLSE